jgi:hypothetical protein
MRSRPSCLPRAWARGAKPKGLPCLQSTASEAVSRVLEGSTRGEALREVIFP